MQTTSKETLIIQVSYFLFKWCEYNLSFICYIRTLQWNWYLCFITLRKIDYHVLDMNLLKHFNRLVQQNTIIYSTINSKSLLSKPPTDTTMVYCKAQTEDYIKKYCFLYYFLQIGIVVFVACIVVFTIGFQKLQHSNSKTGALSK